MKFLMFIKHSEHQRGVQPPKGLMDAMEKFVGESFAKGILKDTGGLKPAKESVFIQSKGGKVTVKDGPFTEAKEMVGGYALVETKTREEALDRRVTEESRRRMGKAKTVEMMEFFHRTYDLTSPVPMRESLIIDNTYLSAADAARQIIEHFNLAENET